MDSGQESHSQVGVIAFALGVLAVVLACLVLLLPAGIHVSGEALGLVLVLAGVGATLSLMAALRH